MHRAVSVATFVLGALGAVSCGSGGDGADPDTSSGAASGVGGTHVAVGQGGMTLGFGGNTGSGAMTGAGGFDPGMTCAATSIEGERVPVDLYFMVDITGSMNCPVPDSASSPCEVEPPKPFAATTRWVVESKALKAFMDSPNNHGLSVGIGFFPNTTVTNDICDSANYVAPKVEIGALPGAAAALNAAINGQKPAGNTPTVASLTGALEHAATWAKGHASHRVGVVYVTDGYPRSCNTSVNTIANAAKVAQSAFEKSGIVTYVLGVGRNLSSLNQIAAAGGTENAYLIETGDDAATALAAALENIRTRSQFGCTYEVPPPPAGQELDYTKVNVRFTSGGQVKDLLKDPSASGCNEGWQYSADRRQVNICGAACDAVKADPAGKLQILFGCQTKVDIPK